MYIELNCYNMILWDLIWNLILIKEILKISQDNKLFRVEK